MVTPQIHLGTVFKLDSTQGGTFVTQPNVIVVDPPPRERPVVSAAELGQDFAGQDVGQEGESQFSFEQHWGPTDTEHLKFDTLMGSRAEADCQIVSSDATAITDEFSFKVVSISRGQITANEMRKRTVTCVRTSAITTS